jgi:hypothetical protein
MLFSDAFLSSLVEFNILGDFLPFTNGDILQVEKYVAQLVTKLQEHPHLLVSRQEVYSSFIEVKVSKTDKSDTQFTQQETTITENTTGLCLYFCTLAPYWFYGACDWSTNWIGCVGGSSLGGSSNFLAPESLAKVDRNLWNTEIEAI